MEISCFKSRCLFGAMDNFVDCLCQSSCLLYTSKYIQFVNRIKSNNYRNKKIIVDKFNSSVKAYKRFEDLFGAGDEERASEYLQDAGMALYVSYEWALKNYLDRRYSEQYRDGDISEEICKTKIAVLQRTEMKYLSKEAESLCIPSFGSIGIDEMCIRDRWNIYNIQEI